MNIESLRSFCLGLPGVKEDVKWGNDLCFLIGEKMFCVTGMNPPFQFSIKVTDDDFQQLTAMPGIIPAPYLARYKWVLIEEPGRLPDKKLQEYIRQSYALIKSKLPKRKISRKSKRKK